MNFTAEMIKKRGHLLLLFALVCVNIFCSIVWHNLHLSIHSCLFLRFPLSRLSRVAFFPVLILACIYGVLGHGSTGASIEALLLGCTFFSLATVLDFFFCEEMDC